MYSLASTSRLGGGGELGVVLQPGIGRGNQRAAEKGVCSSCHGSGHHRGSGDSRKFLHDRCLRVRREHVIANQPPRRRDQFAGKAFAHQLIVQSDENERLYPQL